METDKKTKKQKVKNVDVATEVKVDGPKKEDKTSGDMVYLGICVKTGDKLYKKI